MSLNYLTDTPRPTSLIGAGTKVVDKPSLWHEQHGRVAIPVWINGTFKEGKGKLQADGDKDLMVDYTTFVPYVMAHLHPGAVEPATKFTSVERLESLANRIIFMLPPSTRLSYYLSANYEEIQKKLVSFATEVIEPLGALDVQSSFPILRQLRRRRLVLRKNPSHPKNALTLSLARFKQRS